MDTEHLFYALGGLLAGYGLAYVVANSRNAGWAVSPMPGAQPPLQYAQAPQRPLITQGPAQPPAGINTSNVFNPMGGPALFGVAQ